MLKAAPLTRRSIHARVFIIISIFPVGVCHSSILPQAACYVKPGSKWFLFWFALILGLAELARLLIFGYALTPAFRQGVGGAYLFSFSVSLHHFSSALARTKVRACIQPSA